MGIPSPAGPMIPTQADRETETKMKLQQQKAAQRLVENLMKDQQTKELTVLESMLEPQDEEVPIAA
jgi:hypothetical protein